MSDLLFESSEIPKIDLPSGYTIRPLARDDDTRGALDVLRNLTTVGEISHDQFLAQFEHFVKHSPLYRTIVITAAEGNVVAIGTVLIERKLIHACGTVGHIEDIAVAADQQGKKLGLKLIQSLTQIAKAQGAYKIILDCDRKNVGFYEKCGYVEAGVEMSIRFDK